MSAVLAASAPGEVSPPGPVWVQILKAIVIFLVILQIVPIVLWAERRLLGRFQSRLGPNRVGFAGLLQ
ncbi:MAG TPA: NADH-quinone oxidoreductase subunit H, partial [Thermoleophilaceae bacterium]|nr:NADH-quinone oxidoreductase subunit H [Thermoleophilaceae bacterium]